MNTEILQLGGSYGPLKNGFEFELREGYTALVGENDKGKSSILQFIFKEICRRALFGRFDGVCYIPADRDHVHGTTETAGDNLGNYNQSLFLNVLSKRTIGYEAETVVHPRDLPRLLLNHTSFFDQLKKIGDYLDKLGFPPLKLRGSQKTNFDDIELQFHGTGLRMIFHILAALSDDKMKVILIDEPERSLEARLQKKLKELLVEESKDRAIIVSTHSHLFLNRESVGNNIIVDNVQGEVITKSVSSEKDLIETTFALLGNSAQDLFFPGNFLVVEGSSDQEICNSVAFLLGIGPDEVKILASTGIEKSNRLVDALESNLVSLIAGYSPYSKKVVALIDGPNQDNKTTIESIRKVLGDRCFVLDKDSMEDYIHEDIYTKASLNKITTLDELKAKKSKTEKDDYKKEISKKLSAVLTKEDLEKIPAIKKAILRAKELI